MFPSAPEVSNPHWGRNCFLLFNLHLSPQICSQASWKSKPPKQFYKCYITQQRSLSCCFAKIVFMFFLSMFVVLCSFAQELSRVISIFMGEWTWRILFSLAFWGLTGVTKMRSMTSYRLFTSEKSLTTWLVKDHWQVDRGTFSCHPTNVPNESRTIHLTFHPGLMTDHSLTLVHFLFFLTDKHPVTDISLTCDPSCYQTQFPPLGSLLTSDLDDSQTTHAIDFLSSVLPRVTGLSTFSSPICLWETQLEEDC